MAVRIGQYWRPFSICMSNQKCFSRSLSIMIIHGCVKNNDTSSSNSLAVNCKLPGRSFWYIRKSNSPKIENCGTGFVLAHWTLEYWLLSTTRCNLLLKKLLCILRRFPEAKKETKTKKLLFPEMRVTRKFFTQAVGIHLSIFRRYSLFFFSSFAFSDSCFVCFLFCEIKNVYSDTQPTMQVGEW